MCYKVLHCEDLEPRKAFKKRYIITVSSYFIFSLLVQSPFCAKSSGIVYVLRRWISSYGNVRKKQIGKFLDPVAWLPEVGCSLGCPDRRPWFILFEYIDYTEQRENNETMIVDGVCYSDIHFSRVIPYVWGKSSVVSLFWYFPGEYLVISTSSSVSRCLQTPVSPLQCDAVYDTSFTSFLQDSQPSPLARVL